MRYLTRVEVVYLENRVNRWLRFGRPLKERIIDDSRRHAFFASDSVFCLVDWQSNDYGTIAWRIDILRAVRPQERASEIAGVTPVAEILLRTQGARTVRQVLLLIDEIEAAGISPTLVSREYWRCVHNRLAANEPLTRLSAVTHVASLERRKLQP